MPFGPTIAVNAVQMPIFTNTKAVSVSMVPNNASVLIIGIPMLLLFSGAVYICYSFSPQHLDYHLDKLTMSKPFSKLHLVTPSTWKYLRDGSIVPRKRSFANLQIQNIQIQATSLSWSTICMDGSRLLSTGTNTLSEDCLPQLGQYLHQTTLCNTVPCTLQALDGIVIPFSSPLMVSSMRE